MKREFRLTKSLDYKRVRRLGKSYAHPLFVLVTNPSQGDNHTRIGITTGRSVGKAVDRNRAKRRIKALLEEYYPNIQSGWDIIVIVRQPMVAAPFETIRQTLENQFKRCHLFKA